jgi:hypothetical protein
MGTTNTMGSHVAGWGLTLLRRARAEGHRAARLAGHPASRNIEHPLKKILLYRRCHQFTDELANPPVS